jgi:hypothetical protein
MHGLSIAVGCLECRGAWEMKGHTWWPFDDATADAGTGDLFGGGGGA